MLFIDFSVSSPFYRLVKIEVVTVPFTSTFSWVTHFVQPGRVPKVSVPTSCWWWGASVVLTAEGPSPRFSVSPCFILWIYPTAGCLSSALTPSLGWVLTPSCIQCRVLAGHIGHYTEVPKVHTVFFVWGRELDFWYTGSQMRCHTAAGPPYSTSYHIYCPFSSLSVKCFPLASGYFRTGSTLGGMQWGRDNVWV